MKKERKEISIEEGLKYIESMRLLQADINSPKKHISIRIPENLISSLKMKAKIENRKYQNLIVESIREYLSKDFNR